MSAAADKAGVLAVLEAIAERAHAYRWNERGGVDSANLLWLDERDKNAIAAVATVFQRACDALELLEGIAPHHPQTAKLAHALNAMEASRHV